MGQDMKVAMGKVISNGISNVAESGIKGEGASQRKKAIFFYKAATLFMDWADVC